MLFATISNRTDKSERKEEAPVTAHLPPARLEHRFVSIAVFVLIPVLLLAFGMKTEYEAATWDRDVNLSGSLRYRSLWVYGVTTDQLGEDWRSMLAQMRSIRADLHTRHPRAVAATDTAWNRFASVLAQTGQVDWSTANRMRDAANTLTEVIEREARHGHQAAFWLYLSGVLTTGLSAGLALRSTRHKTRAWRARQVADERFRVLFEYSSDAHLLFDDTGIVDCNLAAIQMLRCRDKAEVLALHPAVLSPEFQPDGRRSMEKCIEMDRLAREKGYHRFEWMHRKADGTDFPVEVTLTPVILNGKDTLLTVWHDLTERKKVEEQLHLLSLVASESLNSIVITDSAERIVYVNPAFERISGRSFEEVRGRRPGDILQGPRTDPGTKRQLREALDAGKPISVEILNYPKTGEPFWLDMHIAPVFDPQGALTHFVAIENNITERKQAQQQLTETNLQLESQMALVNAQAKELELQQASLKAANLQLEQQTAEVQAQKAELQEANLRLTALATTDGLTGLNNHRAFQERLTAEFERTQRYKTPISVILLDVDHFKSYNDTFGHPRGDVVLKTVAAVLKKVARQTDYVCRYGGEEFVIILPNTEAPGAIDAAERFRAAIEEQAWPQRPITASFGISTLHTDLHTDLMTAQDLIARADRALYASKEKGRNRVTHFADIAVLDGLEELEGNASLPYSDIVREMLQIQQDTLTAASGQIREMLVDAYDATILSWSRLLDMKDKETEGHSWRVTGLMMQLGRRIGMNEEEVLYARWGALLHDVGKMSVPDAILHKPGPLTDDEWVIMREHTTTAHDILAPITFLRPALDIPYCHHERWDGTGYPRGLKGEEIPLTARLFSVIDVYDALTSDRPYRSAWSQQRTLDYLRSLSGSHFDPRAVKAFLSMLTPDTQSILSTQKAA